MSPASPYATHEARSQHQRTVRARRVIGNAQRIIADYEAGLQVSRLTLDWARAVVRANIGGQNHG